MRVGVAAVSPRPVGSVAGVGCDVTPWAGDDVGRISGTGGTGGSIGRDGEASSAGTVGASISPRGWIVV